MKHLFTFRQRPNESLTGKLARVSSDTLSQVSAKCRPTVGRLSTLLCLLLLGLGFSQQAWAEGKQEPKGGWQAADTAYVVTPTISTQDTLYLKYEDAKATISDSGTDFDIISKRRGCRCLESIAGRTKALGTI